MKTQSKLLLILLIAIIFSCEDVFEKDITNSIVEALSPINNAEIESNVVSFQWNELSGAKEYRVLVVSSNQSIVLDTLVIKNKFTAPLSAGNYQWQVRGENGAFESKYSALMSFKMIESDNLTNQQVTLSNPANAIYMSNISSLTFSWLPINKATSYSFSINNKSTGMAVVTEPQTTQTSYTPVSGALETEGEYEWQVKATNSANSTATPFAVRTIFIDKTNPNSCVNSFPATNSNLTINTPINFSWTTPADTGTIKSEITLKIEFSNDTNFTTITSTQDVIGTSTSIIFSATGTYYWRIKATDKAGNTSTSAPFSFRI
jgi:hypothetical protein